MVEIPGLVASDVDGTLLDPLNRVTTRTVAAVGAVQGRGVPFILVSGRSPRWIFPVTRAAGVGGYAVCTNGAVLYDIDADRVIRNHILEPPVLSAITHALVSALPDCTVAVERVDEGARAVDGGLFMAEIGHRPTWANAGVITAPLSEVLGRPAVKLTVGHPELTSDQLSVAANAVLHDAVEITFSGDGGLIEISAPGVTKGTGLAEVAARLGMVADDVVAFGDMPNDLPMLCWAGHGVAMANAHASVLAVADEITATNARDGVAALLERWF